MDAMTAFGNSPLFRELDRRALRELAEAAEWRDLHGGEYLHRAGSGADALHLIVNGRIRVQRQGQGDAVEVLEELGLGQIVGEIALMSGGTHLSDALAVRDCRLLRIGRVEFERILRRHPDAMLRLMAAVIKRLRKPPLLHPKDAVRSTRAIAVLPAHEGIDATSFARRLTRELAVAGSVLRVDGERLEGALGEGSAEVAFEHQRNPDVVQWLNRIEDCYRYLVFAANPVPNVWTRRCVRQSDRILLLVDGASAPMDSGNLEWLRGAAINAPLEVVLLHADSSPAAGSTLAWRSACNADTHHHVPADLPAPVMARIARSITGRALCLVLGGGGARGFAHVGLLRALEERGLYPDVIGGTSMGALVGSLAAMGMKSDAILACLRETFVENNFLNDYTLPRLGLIAGDKFRDRLEELFGDRQIEDLPLPFYCESANISRGVTMLHEQGRVADWVGTSMAVPGFTPPNVYQGDLLVDGAVMRSLAFAPMHERGRGPVLVSNVSREIDLHVDAAYSERPTSLARLKKSAHNFNILQLLLQTTGLGGESESREMEQQADLLLYMPVADVGMFDWAQIDEIVYRGYCHADERLDQWMQGNEDEISLENSS